MNRLYEQYIRLIAVLIFTSLGALSGCANHSSLDDFYVPPEDTIASGSPTTAGSNLMTNAQVQLPDWIISPPEATRESFYFVVSAMPQEFGGVDAQRRTALLRAHANIAKYASTVVTSTQTLDSHSTEESGYVEFNEKATEQSTAQISLDQLNAIKDWQHPATSELFLLIEAPLSP